MAKNTDPSRPDRPRSDHVPNIVFMPPANDGGRNKSPSLQTQIRSNAIRNAKAGWKIKSWSDHDSDGFEPQKQIRAPKQSSIRSVDSTDTVSSSDELHMSRFRVNKPVRRESSLRRSSTPKDSETPPPPNRSTSRARDRAHPIATRVDGSSDYASRDVPRSLSTDFGETAAKLLGLYGHSSGGQAQSPSITDLLVDLAPSSDSIWNDMTLHAFVAYVASRPMSGPKTSHQERKIRCHLGQALMETSKLLDSTQGAPDSRICFVLMLLLIIARRMNDERAFLAHLSGLEAVLKKRRANQVDDCLDDDCKTDARIMLALMLADCHEPHGSHTTVEYMASDANVANWALGGYGFIRLAENGYITYTLSQRLQLHALEEESPYHLQQRHTGMRQPNAILEEAIYHTLRLQLHFVLFGISQPQCAATQGRLNAIELALSQLDANETAQYADLSLWLSLTAGCTCDRATAKRAGYDSLLEQSKSLLGWTFDEAIQYLSVHFKWASSMTEAAAYFWNGLESRAGRHCTCKSSPSMSMILLPVITSWAAQPIDPSLLEPAL